MDPISIGIAVGTALMGLAAKKLLEKAADPEVVAKSINWLFSAVDNFRKIRKKERAKDTPVPPPPSPAPAAAPQQEISDSAVEDKTAAAKKIINSAKQPLQAPDGKGVRVAALDDFAMEQLSNDIDSLLTQLNIYLENLRFEEEKAALHGGVQFAPIVVRNTIRIQQEEIARRLVRLNKCMQEAYNVSAPGLDTLLEVSRS